MAYLVLFENILFLNIYCAGVTGVPHNGNNGHHYHEDDPPRGLLASVGDDDTNNGTKQYHEMDDEEEENEGEDKKGASRSRRRKRKLYAAICKQMEFYFSDANITKNRMMREMVVKANKESEGYVDLNAFLEFTKMQQLTAAVADIGKGLSTSDKLELSEDRLRARRKEPFDPEKVKSDEAVEDCTIYVENIPRESEHEWLEKIFQAFGPVAYISLPKFKSGQHKGFAFVEFDDVDAARRCVEAYRGEGACLPSNIDPGELRSIRSFGENEKREREALISSAKVKDQDETTDSPPTEDRQKQKTLPPGQKRKAGEALALHDSEPKIKKGKTEPLTREEDTNEDLTEAVTSSHDVSGSSKSKRKRKKNKAKKTVEVKLESESIMLKVLPKKTWRQLRNRYLNLQRSNMAKLKKQLRREDLRADHLKNFYQPPPPTQQLHHYNHSHLRVEESGANPVLDHILTIRLEKPESSECFRHKISVELAEQDEDEALISGFVKFIDYKDDELQAYVRINGDDSYSTRANNLLKRAKEAFPNARYLSGKKISSLPSKNYSEIPYQMGCRRDTLLRFSFMPKN